VEQQGDSLILHWKSYTKKGSVAILLANTNQFKKGQVDEYQNIANIPIGQGRFAFKIDPALSFAKIILRAKENSVNTQWKNPSIK
jgi:hypothetical protein